MLMTMKQAEFASLDDIALERACIEPLVKMAHENTSAFRTQGFQQLTRGQQALFLFHILYDYVGETVADFYSWISHLFRDQRTWSGIKGGLRYVEDHGMLQLLEEAESVLRREIEARSAELHTTTSWSLDQNTELLVAVQQLHANFHVNVVATLRRFGVYIRNHPDEFVKIQDMAPRASSTSTFSSID